MCKIFVPNGDAILRASEEQFGRLPAALATRDASGMSELTTTLKRN